MNITLNTDAPTSPDYTREVSDAFTESVRVLNHHTAKPGSLEMPSDVYNVVSRLSAGAAGVRQLAGQLSAWLAKEHMSGRVIADDGRTGRRVIEARRDLAEAAAVAETLAEALRRVQDSTSLLAANLPQEGSG